MSDVHDPVAAAMALGGGVLLGGPGSGPPPLEPGELRRVRTPIGLQQLVDVAGFGPEARLATAYIEPDTQILWLVVDAAVDVVHRVGVGEPIPVVIAPSALAEADAAGHMPGAST
jgi:hypothetical protein